MAHFDADEAKNNIDIIKSHATSLTDLGIDGLIAYISVFEIYEIKEKEYGEFTQEAVSAKNETVRVLKKILAEKIETEGEK